MSEDNKKISIVELYKKRKPISENFKYYKKHGIDYLMY